MTDQVVVPSKDNLVVSTADIVSDSTARVLSVEAARALTNQIKLGLRVCYDLVSEAYFGKVWIPLGYTSWDLYCAGELADARLLRLNVEQRREIVAEMRAAGMSSRAIAAGIGVHHSTVADDVKAPVGDPTPGHPITGRDGKRYPSHPRGADAQEVSGAPGFAQRYDRAIRDLARAVKRVTDLHCADEFMPVRSRLGRSHLTLLNAALCSLGTVVEDLRAGSGSGDIR